MEEKKMEEKMKELAVSEDPSKTQVRDVLQAKFVENVEEHMKNYENADIALKEQQDNYNKYKLISTRLTQSRATLRAKIPEIEQSMKVINHLETKKEEGESVITHFELSDTIYATAEIKDPQSVCLWLGANVMVEYSFEEAKALLNQNLKTAKQNLESVEQDLDFLKEQITITEVNLARIFNYDVKLRRKAKEVKK